MGMTKKRPQPGLHPAVVRDYETLVSSLQLAASTMPLKSLLVTSTQPGEGKTTVTVNLACALSLAGKKVLVVDADLRKPRLHEHLRCSRAPGLAEILQGDEGIDKAIQTVTVASGTGERTFTLDFIPSGKAVRNLFRLLSDLKLKTDLAFLRNTYDVVLLDTPPALAVNDVLVLAPGVDGILFVLACGLVKERDAQIAKERIERAGGRLLGVVINRFREGLHGEGFHPYRDYYEDTVP
ncbi:CpsD/CapB family tyrosine-protein kinase [Candidatus Nitrospira bockiana]